MTAGFWLGSCLISYRPYFGEWVKDERVRLKSFPKI
jgi:hypothetical protein